MRSPLRRLKINTYYYKERCGFRLFFLVAYMSTLFLKVCDSQIESLLEERPWERVKKKKDSVEVGNSNFIRHLHKPTHEFNVVGGVVVDT